LPSTLRPLDLIPHRRYNPLLRQWILVSPQRTQRPWQGETTRPVSAPGIEYDPTCYLCPGNARSGGQRNPAYTGVFAFNNDFPALLPDAPPASEPNSSPLLISEPERGICRVLCFHPNHSLTLARMNVPDIARVVDAWADETATLSELPWINHVQIFENRGAMMGASNPHPHCQIWATEHIPDEPLRELAAQQAYRDEHHSCLLCDYVATELAQANSVDECQNRFVAKNDSFIALVPYWATWPFETLVLPRRHLGSFVDLTSAERTALAQILKAVTTRYDNLFEVSFPYTMGFHQRPAHGQGHDAMHFHAHFYPPLLRSAEIRKFMVGFEMLGMPQRDLTPETAAARLRAVPEKHYAE
jgi:UDPglucose--hexose-1-phosphate uridylyltransferase